MRKIILSVAAVAMLAIPAAASANVAVDNGTGYVGKGDVQSALKWNNADFDRGTVTFTAGVTKSYDNVLTCADGSDRHVVVSNGGTGTVAKTPVLSANGKQITGWNLTGADSSAVAGNDFMAVMVATTTICRPDKPVSEMTPEELHRMPIRMAFGAETLTLDGLKVNGVALPNTPVV